jgi:O-methyltransferase involved in polyketide biosynthesis
VAHILADANAGKMPKLYFQAASILDGEQLNRAVANFTDGPIAIITEGLLSYLTLQEKTVAAKNVRALLASRGGAWIVTDLTRVFRPDDEKAAELRQRIVTATGFSPITGCFVSIGEARRFFKRLGFKVHDYRRSEIMDSLSTLRSSGLSDNQIRKLLEPQATFALEVRP